MTDPVTDAVVDPVAAPAEKKQLKRPPFYWRALRLRHVRPSSWQRAVFVEGSLAVAVVLVLADLATAWLIIALPLVVAVVVKAQDVLVGWLVEPAPSRVDRFEVEPVDVTNAPVEGWTEVEPEPEPSVRVVPAPRAVRSRPGAAAARAQASTAGARRRTTRTTPTRGKKAT